MIQKLKRKFVLLSMLSLFALLLLLVAGMNSLNYTSVVREADDLLAMLSQDRGDFPELGGGRGGGADGDRGMGGNWGRPFLPGMSPELPNESRYFSVLLDGQGQVLRAETGMVLSIDDEGAAQYAYAAAEKSRDRGFLDGFRYLRTAEGNNTRITFLDCEQKLDAFRRFLTISVILALAGFAAVFFVISFFAGRIIRPISESYEKQKRFITDAGHEIKTPLTIINANVDLLEMDLGGNESLTDIRQQTGRLTRLTDDLVYLARMEEAENKPLMIEFPVSEVIQETAMPFHALAQAQGKEFTCTVQPMLSMRGNEKAIAQLVSLLMDNALKYSPAGGAVALELSRQGKSLRLTVFNTTEAPVAPETLPHVFDRFYRTDPSRNSETGGHGIGLSVAKAIVTAHGGKIQAGTPDGHSFRITALLPV